MKKEELKELSAIIQICDCGKVGAYKDDGHDCCQTIQNQEAQEFYD